MSFELLLDVIYAKTMESWKTRNRDALAALFGSRYRKRAEESVKLRAPDMQGSETGVPYAAYIHPSNPDAGPYGGMSFVLFPAEDSPGLIGMGIGTNGLAPDEAILGRPGHARKMRAICAWLNHSFGHGDLVAWAKHDPTRIDTDLPEAVERAWSAYDRVFKRYGKVMYALYKPTDERSATADALAAMLDVMFEERGEFPLAAYKAESESIQSNWFAHLMPDTNQAEIIDLLKQRRYVILQGTPGTGKTRMAGMILANDYAGFGRSIQFHPNATYESFIGGLAPSQAHADGALGFRFEPTPGFLMEAASAASADSSKPYLLHIDEINRADLSKILGEAIYLLEPEAEKRREITLAYNFGEPFHRTLHLPDNLHVLGTMNTADRSIGIVDVAVRRRFAFWSMWPSSAAVRDCGCELTMSAFEKLISIFVEHAPDDAFDLVPGHSYFLEKDRDRAKRNLRTSLAPLLREYLAQGYVGGFAEPIRSYLQWLDSL
ncbi:MAG TPA: AAA family ATPase [Terriglobia bacterium]|jgi:5-methylcytosine-specific restriction protein B|nr:AAA family ATPase [Terriglobia bacterium]